MLTSRLPDFAAGLSSIHKTARSAGSRAISVLLVADAAGAEATAFALDGLTSFEASVAQVRDFDAMQDQPGLDDFDVALLAGRPGLDVFARDIEDETVCSTPLPAILLNPGPLASVPGLSHIPAAVQVLDLTTLTPDGLDNAIRCALHMRDLRGQLEDAQIELECARRARATFFAKLGNDVIVPIKALLGYAETLEAPADGAGPPDPAGDATRRIRESGQHLLEMVSNLVQHGLNQSNYMGPKFAPEDLTALTGRALGIVEILRARYGHSLDLTAPADGLVIDCQRAGVTQAIVNLLTNAIRYTPPGGRITVEIRASERYAEIDVSDNGVGMSQAEISTALVPFGRVGAAANGEYDGTGIGLPIVRDIAARHRGQLDLDSAPGRGTTVVLRLPLPDHG